MMMIIDVLVFLIESILNSRAAVLFDLSVETAWRNSVFPVNQDCGLKLYRILNEET